MSKKKKIPKSRLDDYAAQEANVNICVQRLTRIGGTKEEWAEIKEEIKRLRNDILNK